MNQGKVSLTQQQAHIFVFFFPKIFSSKGTYANHFMRYNIMLLLFNKWFSYHYFQSFLLIILLFFVRLFYVYHILCFACVFYYFQDLMSVQDEKGSKTSKAWKNVKSRKIFIQNPGGCYGHPQQLLRVVAVRTQRSLLFKLLVHKEEA